MRLFGKGSRLCSAGFCFFSKAQWGFGLGLTVLGIIGLRLGIPDLDRQVRTDVPLIRHWFPAPIDCTKLIGIWPQKGMRP